MMQAADEVIVVADSTKFGHASLTHLCDLSAIDILVTDDELDSAWKSQLESEGVKVLAAEAPEKTAINQSDAGVPGS
jgi:DeoR/GlpR family transcriptional regulator of sugar metabolism